MKILHFFKYIRDLYYQYIVWNKYTIGKGFHCGRGVFLWARNEITIGDDFYIGKYSIIETNCRIGNGVIIGNHVGIVGKYDHCYQQIDTPIRLSCCIKDKNYNWKGCNEMTIIGDDVWIGYSSTIMSGVQIANGCIIGAGSVVTKNTEPYCIYAGVPAKKINTRFDNEDDLKKHVSCIDKKYHN